MVVGFVASKISEGNIRHVPSSDDNNISLVGIQ